MIEGSVTELLSHNEHSTLQSAQSAQSDPTNRHSTIDTVWPGFCWCMCINYVDIMEPLVAINTSHPSNRNKIKPSYSRKETGSEVVTKPPDEGVIE